MGCNSCDGSSCDNTGALDNEQHSDSHTWTPPDDWYCSDESITSNFEIELNTSAFDNGTAYDEIHTTKNWWPTSYFTDLPEALIDKQSCNHSDDCDYDGCTEPHCDRVEYVVQQGDVSSGDERAYYDFEDPRPDDSGSTGGNNALFDLVLNLVSVAGGTYGSLGAGLVKAFYDPSGADPVDLNQGFVTSNSDRHQWWWTINMNGQGLPSFPQDQCESTGVRLTINNKENEDNRQFRTDSFARYDIIYPTYGGDDCRCEWYGGDYVVKTTEWAANYNYWETT